MSDRNSHEKQEVYGAEMTGHHLYDLMCDKVFYSCDVLFDESSRGIENPVKEEEKFEKYVWNFTVYMFLKWLMKKKLPMKRQNLCCIHQRGREGQVTIVESRQWSQAVSQVNSGPSKKPRQGQMGGWNAKGN